MESLVHIAKLTFRRLCYSPAYTATIICILALGIGTSTATFTLLHALLFQPLPVYRSSQLYRLGDVEHCCVISGLEGNWSLFSYDLYKSFRNTITAFDNIAAFQATKTEITSRSPGAHISTRAHFAEFVSGNYFITFGINPHLGRLFADTDDVRELLPS
jgi:hypothetical protein